MTWGWANALGSIGRGNFGSLAVVLAKIEALDLSFEESEREAIQHLLNALNQRELILPSDNTRLPLRFSLALSHR
jgi:hypothetical protein